LQEDCGWPADHSFFGKRNNQFVWHSRPKLLVQTCSPTALCRIPFGRVLSWDQEELQELALTFLEVFFGVIGEPKEKANR
jgi:hypothetical protein